MTDKIILPDISEPLIDKDTGRMSANWYRFFARLMVRLQAGGI